MVPFTRVNVAALVTGYKYNLQKILYFAYNGDPDEMLHNAAFHLGLHCLH